MDWNISHVFVSVFRESSGDFTDRGMGTCIITCLLSDCEESRSLLRIFVLYDPSVSYDLSELLILPV